MGQKMENQKSKGKLFARAKVMAMSLALCMSLTACSTTSEPNYSGEVSDPFEELNRKTFAFNEALDKAVFNPVVKGYRTVVPQPARTGVRNFVRNLNSPIIVGNQILQGDVEGAAGGVTRFAVNTVFGVGGLIDVAADAGLPYEKEDFGQTLAVWGVGSGPYVVMPIFGPSTMRDATGSLVDGYADPLRIYLDNIDEEEWIYARAGLQGLVAKDEFYDVLNDLRMNSFDYYAAVRSVYIQNRNALINDQDPEMAAGPAIPDYDDE